MPNADKEKVLRLAANALAKAKTKLRRAEQNVRHAEKRREDAAVALQRDRMEEEAAKLRAAGYAPYSNSREFPQPWLHVFKNAATGHRVALRWAHWMEPQQPIRIDLGMHNDAAKPRAD